MDACDQAALVFSKEVEPADLIEDAIRRLRDADERLNLVVTPLFERARSSPRPRPTASLPGVPMLVKDLQATIAGIPHRAGSSFTRGFIAGSSSHLVTRFEHAGLSILGTSNASEFGLLSSCEPAATGPTLNPWATDRSPGGSSGGSAAAVASGAVPIAHANDSGGSIRIPASDCGVFGLKPSRARNSLAPFGDIAAGLWAEHVITRSVRDSAVVLDATHGPVVGDPYCAPPVESSFLEATKRPPRTLRIGLTATRLDGTNVHPDCRRAAEVAAEACEALGHEVTEATPRFDHAGTGAAFVGLIADGLRWMTERWIRILGREPAPGELEPATLAFLALAETRSAADHLRDLERTHRATRELATFFDGYDLLLTPTMSMPPVERGYMSGAISDLDELLARDETMSGFTWLANITGGAAMSIPLYWTGGGLPIGSHFLAPLGDERMLFALAAQLEQAVPWCDRWPP